MDDDDPTAVVGRAAARPSPDHEVALAVGSRLDLSDCVYGETDAGPSSTPHRYYAFLAGLVRSRGYRRVVEVGTHHGGSTLALCHGVAAEHTAEACVVTVDVTRLNEEALAPIPFLHRVQGDSLRPEVVQEVCAHFDGPIDLLYVDSVHQHRETLQNIAVFANRLRPAVVVVDDIHLNPPMRDLWREVRSLDVGTATDVSSLVGRRSAGFGVVECDPGARWPEVRGRRLEAWLAWRRVHGFLDRSVPERVQVAARPALIRLEARLRRR